MRVNFAMVYITSRNNACNFAKLLRSME